MSLKSFLYTFCPLKASLLTWVQELSLMSAIPKVCLSLCWSFIAIVFPHDSKMATRSHQLCCILPATPLIIGIKMNSSIASHFTNSWQGLFLASVTVDRTQWLDRPGLEPSPGALERTGQHTEESMLGKQDRILFRSGGKGCCIVQYHRCHCRWREKNDTETF